MNRVLLCTDLDRTLIPNGDAPESEFARSTFYRFVSGSNVTLVYVTGRDKNLVLQAISDYELPLPDYVIANVGSTIYKVNQSHWKHQQSWDELISKDWNGNTGIMLQDYLNEIKGIRLQEFQKQHAYKLSYYVSLDDDHSAITKDIETILISRGVKVNVIWSIDEQHNIGLLDILPASAGKRQAIEFLMHQLGFDYSNTVFAGDSGNDICVLCSPIQSILVANASTEVRLAAIKQAKLNQQEKALYLAHGGFQGMNGNYSAGILEGVHHYMPEAGNWHKGEI